MVILLMPPRGHKVMHRGFQLIGSCKHKANALCDEHRNSCAIPLLVAAATIALKSLTNCSTVALLG